MSFNDLFRKESELRKSNEDGKEKSAPQTKPETASKEKDSEGTAPS